MNILELRVFTLSAFMGASSFWFVAMTPVLPGFACEASETKGGLSRSAYPFWALSNHPVVRTQGEREAAWKDTQRVGTQSRSVKGSGADSPEARPSRAGIKPGPLSLSALRTMASHQARRCRVPQGLYVRLVARESSFNPRAISPSGARGLAQVMPVHAHPLLDMDDPLTNLSMGCAFLRRRFEASGSWRAALADYNAGPSRTSTSQATLAYIDDILKGN